MRELAGALGDYGTFLPFAVGYLTVCGMDPAGFLLVMGLANILTGLWYRLPLPIEPQKVLGTVAIAQHWSPSLVYAAGFGTGLVWLLLGLTGWIRRVAVMVLVDSPEEEAVQLLMIALGDSDELVRMEAAKVIDEVDPQEILDALVEALTSADEQVRNAAANALADIKDTAMAPALITALKEDDTFVLAAILRALKHLRIKDAAPHAIALLDHADATVRREAVGVLGYLQAPGGFALSRILADLTTLVGKRYRASFDGASNGGHRDAKPHVERLHMYDLCGRVKPHIDLSPAVLMRPGIVDFIRRQYLE